MPSDVFSTQVATVIRDAQLAAQQRQVRNAIVDGVTRSVLYPFPSPVDWRDCWVYFLMLDRFNRSDGVAPAGTWDAQYGLRQGGTFKGVQAQLGYLEQLGVGAIWLSPVLKNVRPSYQFNYHGYGAQDFLTIDDRFASDRTTATAERELSELVGEAHARGMYVIADIVLNHAGRVFDYFRDGKVQQTVNDPGLLSAPLGQEASIWWLDGGGNTPPGWQDSLPPSSNLGPENAVWPADLQRVEFFRRRGTKQTDNAPEGGFIVGDFGDLRQLVVEYDARAPSLAALRQQYGTTPVLTVLVQAYKYLIARFDFDGYRLDTAKYIREDMLEIFGNAMREFALSIGKSNFFTFGEIANREERIVNCFVGRHSTETEGFGIDAALDFPLFDALPWAAKALTPVERLRQIFADRKKEEEGLLSSHGEAGRYFVTFLDNHDQGARFNHPQALSLQISLGLGLLFTLQGIPCVYYGTEQGLDGAKDAHGHLALGNPESVREALWGRTTPPAFGQHPLYQQVQSLANLRRREPPLRFGRLYFREVSGNVHDFGHSTGSGGVVAFSRILADREVVVVANTSPSRPFSGAVVVDLDLSSRNASMSIRHSNLGNQATVSIQRVNGPVFYDEQGRGTPVSVTVALPVSLAPMELQVFGP